MEERALAALGKTLLPCHTGKQGAPIEIQIRSWAVKVWGKYRERQKVGWVSFVESTAQGSFRPSGQKDCFRPPIEVFLMKQEGWIPYWNFINICRKCYKSEIKIHKR
jgi:hypothetical protein